MQRSKYAGGILVISESRGLYILWKWNGKEYAINRVLPVTRDGNLSSLPKVNFRLSKSDRETINKMLRRHES